LYLCYSQRFSSKKEVRNWIMDFEKCDHHEKYGDDRDTIHLFGGVDVAAVKTLVVHQMRLHAKTKNRLF